jgi:CBS domain-containing protein
LIERLSKRGDRSEKFEIEFDEREGFPPTPADKIMDVNSFNSKITGPECDTEQVLLSVGTEYFDALIDVRPYMQEYPHTVSVNDPLEKCLQIFLSNHLRHLCVVNPTDGACVGVITRKDLFAYVNL